MNRAAAANSFINDGPVNDGRMIDVPIIDVRDLRFAWQRSAGNVLDIDRFVVDAGERVFLQGPSGSGKTTLLSILGAVARPNQGEVWINGTKVSALRGSVRDQFRVDQIGFLFQMFNLIPYLSPLQNVLLPCRFSARRNKSASRERSLTEEARRLLSQLGLSGKLVKQRAGNLSVGQQQRVAAARALIGSPELIIADEPTSALDADARINFLHLLFDECNRNGATILFVSHDRALADQFDRTVNLVDINHVHLTGSAGGMTNDMTRPGA